MRYLCAMTALPDLTLRTRPGLPDALRVLAAAYPREDWPAHDNFNAMVQFWMQRHLMFRQLLDILRKDIEALRDARIDPQAYAPRLSHYGGTFISELHTHHHVEDEHYFPRLIKLDARLERGFAMLDADHHALDPMIDGLAMAANGLLRGGDDPGRFHAQLTAFEGLLNRHLTDEEELVVPVILQSGFAG